MYDAGERLGFWGGVLLLGGGAHFGRIMPHTYTHARPSTHTY